MQKENIKSFEPKKEAVHDLYNHTHELMKRLVWSSGKHFRQIYSGLVAASSSCHLADPTSN
jgi:hypothetical protein